MDLVAYLQIELFDEIAKKNPDKLAMMWVANDKTDRKFKRLYFKDFCCSPVWEISFHAGRRCIHTT